jgi:hypothetical protein
VGIDAKAEALAYLEKGEARPSTDTGILRCAQNDIQDKKRVLGMKPGEKAPRTTQDAQNDMSRWEN